jgi:acyl-CoA synthetase (AMP-forming)/AMP-acid ligase II
MITVIPSVLKYRANIHPDRLAYIFENTHCTYARYYHEAVQTANFLHSLGLKKGDRIGILDFNNPGPAKNFFRLLTTSCIFIMMGAFFRSTNIAEAWYILKSMVTLKPGGIFKGEPPRSFGYYVFAIVLLLTVEYVQELYPNFKVVSNNNVIVRYTGYVLLITILLLTGVFNGSQFIYFQF